MSGQDPHDEWAMLACSGPLGLSFQSQAKASSTASALAEDSGWLLSCISIQSQPRGRSLGLSSKEIV